MRQVRAFNVCSGMFQIQTPYFYVYFLYFWPRCGAVRRWRALIREKWYYFVQIMRGNAIVCISRCVVIRQRVSRRGFRENVSFWKLELKVGLEHHQQPQRGGTCRSLSSRTQVLLLHHSLRRNVGRIKKDFDLGKIINCNGFQVEFCVRNNEEEFGGDGEFVGRAPMPSCSPFVKCCPLDASKGCFEHPQKYCIRTASPDVEPSKDMLRWWGAPKSLHSRLRYTPFLLATRLAALPMHFWDLNINYVIQFCHHQMHKKLFSISAFSLRFFDNLLNEIFTCAEENWENAAAHDISWTWK